MTATDKTPIAVLGIAEIASTGLVAAILDPVGSIAAIRAQVQDSVYWSEFCQLVKAGDVTETFLPGALGIAVIGWARQWGVS
jgi:hypothetical protein